MSVSWLPVVVAALSILGAVATYAYQKRVDRQSSLIELRRTAYREFIDAFVDMTNNVDADDNVTRKFQKKEFDLLVVASDEVVRSVGELSKFYEETNDERFQRDIIKTKELVGKMCASMREDCFETTNLSIEDIKKIIPIAERLETNR